MYSIKPRRKQLKSKPSFPIDFKDTAAVPPQLNIQVDKAATFPGINPKSDNSPSSSSTSSATDPDHLSPRRPPRPSVYDQVAKLSAEVNDLKIRMEEEGKKQEIRERYLADNILFTHRLDKKINYIVQLLTLNNAPQPEAQEENHSQAQEYSMNERIPSFNSVSKGSQSSAVTLGTRSATPTTRFVNEDDNMENQNSRNTRTTAKSRTSSHASSYATVYKLQTRLAQTGQPNAARPAPVVLNQRPKKAENPEPKSIWACCRPTPIKVAPAPQTAAAKSNYRK